MKYYTYNIITWALSCLRIIKRGSPHYRTEPRNRGDMPEVPKELFVVPNETGIISIPDKFIAEWNDLPVPSSSLPTLPPPPKPILLWD